MEIIAVQKDKYSEAITLLQEVLLPVADINERVELFALQDENKTVGTIGWETDGTTALLRSLGVKEDKRQNGYGKALVGFLERHAKQNGVNSFYLLTTTAASFFSKRGFEIIERTEAPPFIQQTVAFKSLCPASATVMKKEL